MKKLMKIMTPKITCPHCNEEFPMEEGLSIHLKKIEEKRKQEIEKKQEIKWIKILFVYVKIRL